MDLKELDDEVVLTLMEELLRLDAAGLIELPKTYSVHETIAAVRSRYPADADVQRVCQLTEELSRAAKALHDQVQELTAALNAREPERAH